MSYTCEQQIEAEANFAAGRLLFLQEVFSERLESEPIDFARVKQLSREFGNTITSTLWRIVESVDDPLFGLVSQHPRRLAPSGDAVVRYFLRSRSFEHRIRNVTSREIFDSLRTFCCGYRGPIGSDEVLLRDQNGGQHVLFLETFFNGYEALTLGVHRRIRSTLVASPNPGAL